MGWFRCLAAVILLAVSCQHPQAAPGDLLPGFLKTVEPADLNASANAYGAPEANPPVVPLHGASGVVGWVFLTSDFVSTTGYSGKPIHTLVAIDRDAVITGVRLVEHSEPIVLIGIPESKIQAVTERYAGLDLKREAEKQGSGHDLEIISGATVTIIVIDDSIVRAGLKVARALELGGLKSPQKAGAEQEIDAAATAPDGWSRLIGEGSIGALTLDVGQTNEAFRAGGHVEAAARPEKGAPSDLYIELKTALVTVPAIGKALLGEAEYGNLLARLGPGEHAILVMGRGRYSFKGSGYVRGGLFDRIQLIQGDTGVRFSDKDHWRLGEIAAAGAPSFPELDIFRIPATIGFDPVEPWRLQLLVQRAIGPVKKSFITFDLAYRLPARYLRTLAPAATEHAAEDAAEQTEAQAQSALWRRIWLKRRYEIAGLAIMLAVLTGVFFFQLFATRSERFLYWFRIGFLSVTLVFLGWYANAQLSVVNIMALAGSLQSGFTWSAFLLDPLVFILWFSVAAALIFWGRGAYCGWLCPFGALQELLNRIAKLFRVPQWQVPWALHERLWSIKYIIFLGLFGVSLASIPLAESYAETEPFKTAIILKFNRSWPFVAYAAVLLGAGLFVERFYCRYLCPLGAALAIPARMRMFDWLKRYKECGAPCHRCAQECMVQAIHPTGEINPNECHNCLHCQVLYQHKTKCPVCIKIWKRREPFLRQARAGKAREKTAAGPA